MTTTEIAPDVPAEPDADPAEPARAGWGLGIVLIAISVVALIIAGVLVARLVQPDASGGRTIT
ncbi:MAG: hypothetical protein KF703_10915, partial [Actinobacteria bacterium]|nr:hypothetical protein [Actinomycetota bacterium]